MKPPTPPASPNTIPWPPILAVGAALGALGLGWLWPLPGLVPRPAVPVGVAIMLGGLGLDLSAIWAMRRHHANILPHRAATALVTAWPFSMSRNPIYLGNTIALAGAALALRNPWFVGAAAASAWGVTILAIRREERHLSAMFGAAWAAYSARVPRWLRLLP